MEQLSTFKHALIKHSKCQQKDLKSVATSSNTSPGDAYMLVVSLYQWR